MIDKVASVLCLEAFNLRNTNPAKHWEGMSDRTKAIYRRAAIAVIKAMREPTDQMLVDSGTMTGFCNECSHLEADAAHIEWWQLMIDRALAICPPKNNGGSSD